MEFLNREVKLSQNDLNFLSREKGDYSLIPLSHYNTNTQFIFRSMIPVATLITSQIGQHKFLCL